MKYSPLILVLFFIGACNNKPDNKHATVNRSELLADSLCIDVHLLDALDRQTAPFYHGVASGDPTQTSVIIWTRITLDSSVEKADVEWEISDTPGFKKTIKSGHASTSSEKDFTVKIDVEGLEPDTPYYYRFVFEGSYSATGETRTFPENPEQVVIAFASCSNFEWGYFNAYRLMAENKDIQVVVHLGDYIYEYGPGTYGDTAHGRKHVPAKECLTLQDYRTRYSQYRLDPDLILAHRKKPFITTWDDHELANNAYVEGAQNHTDSTEGDWQSRKEAAIQAYYEWLPVREPKDHLYRSFSIGNLLNLIILDTRIAGRTVQVSGSDDKTYQYPERSILGSAQKQWLTAHLESNHAWRIIGNQVPFGPMRIPQDSTVELYMDGWDGYPGERRNILELIGTLNVNTVFVTGDFHSSFALENDLNATADVSDNVSVEFIVPSISSANINEYADETETERIRQRYLTENPHIRYANLSDHGFVLVTVQKDLILGEFVYCKTVKKPDPGFQVKQSFVVQSGQKALQKDRH